MIKKMYLQKLFGAILIVAMCFSMFAGLFSTAETSAVSTGTTTVSVIIGGDNAPVIETITPNSGPTDGGTVITITGRDLDYVTEVTLDGLACTNIIIINSTTIKCTTPAHPAGAVDVVVTTVEGWTFTKVGGFTYIAKPKPPLPLPPDTGLFSLGNFGTVTSYDIFFIAAILLVVGGVMFLVACKNKRSTYKHGGEKRSKKTKSAKKR